MARALPLFAAIILLGPVAAASVSAESELALDQALSLARKSSEAIRLSNLALEKSKAALGEAQAKALPHVDLEASASYLVNPPPGYTVAAGALGSIPIPPTYTTTLPIPPNNFNVGAALHNYVSLTASLKQPLFTWGKIKNAIDLASLQVDAAGTDVSARQKDIELQVRKSYFSALLARKSQEALKRMRDTAAGMAADRQKAFDQGTMNRESLLEAKSTLASLEARLVEAGQSESTALENLRVLTGVDAGSMELATDFRSSLPPLDEQELLAKALEGSPDMTAARTRIEQARRKLSVEEGGAILHPDVNLGISLDIAGQEDFPYSGAWTFSNNTWNVDLLLTLGITMSAFDGMESFHRIQEAEKDSDMAGVAFSQQAKIVRIQVRQTVEAAVKADADAQAGGARAEYLQEKLRNTGVALANGQASQEDQRGAAIQADAAELDLLLALYTRESALADLQKLTGAQP
ncbi:MAG: TolC family protein [Spirochaetia bacterium]